MRRLSILLLSLITTLVQLQAQELEGVIFDNHVYQENIASVTFRLEDLFLSLPVVNIDTDLPLILEFDDLDGDVKDYSYTFVHCDQFWKPTNIAQLEYLDGFGDDRVTDYSYSFKTLKQFTHYQVEVPSRNMRWTNSGNYLLIIYEDEGDKIPVISRRFVVVDPRIRVDGGLVPPAQVSKTRTHHEIDFSVDYQKFPMRSPQQEVKATILQNGRWDNAIIGLPPNFTRLNNIVFDYQDKIVFPAGKEFRYADLRSFRLSGPSIAEIELSDEYYEVYLMPDDLRNNQVYITRRDANGNFVIETQDQNDWALSSEYAYVRFFLKTGQAFYDDEIYLFGAFSDWQIKPEFRMEYNAAINAYIGMVLLKQGYYEYEYVTVPRNRKKGEPLKVSQEKTEGNWYETEDEYQVLIYYRPFGERYDQVIGSYTISSAN
ncbi:MAG: DUF5103 domain-containing protein [Saprospiraceae bacterium]